MGNVQAEQRDRLEKGLQRKGLRPTRHRELVYGILADTTAHPSAEEVFARARARESSISLATVYNCLDTLVDCGLVNAVHNGRSSTRYCSNECRHAHFHDVSGDVEDVPLSEEAVRYLLALAPEGCKVESVELNFTGRRDVREKP